MSAVESVLTGLDGMDEEHQQLAAERLHFLRFMRSLPPKGCRCGEPVPVLGDGPKPGERRRIECGQCGQFVAWLPKFKNQNRRARHTVGHAVGNICQMCQREGIRLEGHHVIAVENGGTDAPENIWSICEPCHVVIHALRRMASAMVEKQP